MSKPIKRRPGTRRTLSDDEILDAALVLLDAGGSGAVSVRGIAAHVGVAPNAVYTYFPDKAAVVRALADRLLGDVDDGVFADRRRPWRIRVEAAALELRQRLSRHPDAVQLMISGPMDGPHAMDLNERLLELLADAGLDPADAARAAYLLIVYVVGSIAMEIAGRDRPGALRPETERVAARTISPDSPADQHPRTAAASVTTARYVSTEQYLWGLHRILDAITDVPADSHGPAVTDATDPTDPTDPPQSRTSRSSTVPKGDPSDHRLHQAWADREPLTRPER